MKRILALDYGKKRIGVAVTDPLGITAQGLPTYERSRIRDDLRALAGIAHEMEVGLIVIGEPVHLNGQAGPAAVAVREFARRLESVSRLPVRLFDERLTSVEAHEILDEAGVPRHRRKGAVDRLAAVLLLERYLEANPA